MNRLRRRSEFLRRLHAEMLELRLPLDGDSEILTSLQVMSMTPTESGVKFRFNQPLNSAVLNTVDNSAWGASDITLSGTASGPIAGSVVTDHDHQGFTFIKTGNPLVDDNYTVTLRSAADGIASSAGDLLDGNGDGSSGDSYVSNFSVTLPESAVTVSVGDFMRGYGQAVNLPANSDAGIPITLSTGLNVAAATIVVEYDPKLLTITGGRTPLAGATASIDTNTPGRVVVQVTSDTQFSGTNGPITLANLTATVPVSAPYAAKEILDLTVVSLTDATSERGAIPAVADDGFHVASFRGDLNGDQLITSGDITLASRFQSELPGTVGFSLLQLVDPQFAADMNDDGLVTAADPAGMLRFLSGEAGGFPQIPALPVGLTPPLTFGADPQIFIPTTGLSGGVGAVITVPIRINVTEAGGISFAGANFTFTYDSSRFAISNVRFGGALFGLGFLESNNIATPGVATFVSVMGVGPSFSQGFVGDLYLFDLTVQAGAAAGSSAINLQASSNASDNDTFTLLLAPAILNGADPNDGVITVIGANNNPTANDDTATVAEDSGATAIPVLANDSFAPDVGETLLITSFTPSANGTVVITGGGTGLTFQPNANFNGATSFTYTISDGNGGTATATVNVTVTAVNDNPTATNDAATVAEDSAATAISVLANDSIAPDTGETLSITAVTQPANGTVVITGGGTGLTFQPAANFFGATSFTYTISDGNGGTATATVNVTVTAVNDNPTATNDAATVAEDSSATAINVLTNDSIAPDVGETLSITAVTQPANGTVVITGGGTGLTFQPAANFFGATSFTYTISDGNGGTATATVNVTVTNVNDNPTANTDAATVAEDSGATAINVLTNDSIAPDTGETLSITAVTQPANGTVVITGGGTGLTFQPAANFFGATSFTYTISDGNGGTATATVNVTVTAVNDNPTATNDAATVAEDSAAAAIAVLANDSIAPDTGETLSITAVTQPANGTVVITGGGTGLTFQPSANFFGATSFTYTISDGNGGTATATVNVTVTNVNDNPTATNDAATVAEDSAAAAIAVLANDSIAPDTGETLSITSVTQPANGTVVITGGGTGLTFQPAANFFGATSFTYTISDGNGGTATATVNVTVTAVNDNPTATNDAATVAEDSAATAIAVLANDSIAPDTGETLSITAVTQPANGTVVITGGGTGLTFQPAANFFGATSFTYTISDGNGGTATATVNVTVTNVNDNPTATNDAATVAEDSAATAIAVLANDSIAPDTGETLSITAVTQPANGTVVITGGGTGLTFQPAANFFGATSFTYTISDGNGGTATATVNVTVTAVNDNPTAANDAATVPENAPATAIPVLANDSIAPDTGETLTITAVTQPANGTVVITGLGTGLTFQPNASFNGLTSFTYTISDGNGGTATATVNINVSSVNQPPTANDDTATVAEDALATAIAVLANDSFAPDVGETLTITAVTQPTNGTVVITGSGTGLTFQPAADFHGATSFTYTISDGNGGNASATVNVTVTPVADITNDALTTSEDVAITANVITGTSGATADTFENGGRTLTSVTNGANGSVTFLANGSVTYTPNANFHGSDSFTYTVTSAGNSETATVNVTVTPVNDLPTANNDLLTISEDDFATTSNVLSNDTFAPDTGETLTITAVTQPVGGTVVITGGGTSVTFQPTANFNGATSFTYTISDGNGGTATATVSVMVSPVNDPPTATNDSLTVSENAPATPINVLANDSFAPDTGETLTITSFTPSPNGTVVITGGGTGLTFQPTAFFNGATSFTYTISDGNGGNATATVNVNVTSVNQLPTAVNDTATIAEDSAATAINVLANDSFAPDTGETLTITAVTQPANGTVVITGGGTGLTVQPTANFFGATSFTYTISDGNGGNATATVNVTVTSVNDLPTATNDTATVGEDSAATAINVLANDSFAPDTGETLTITAVTQPANGTVVITGGGTGLTFQPTANFFGPTSFTYTVNDSNGGTATATVNVTVTPVNDVPTFVVGPNQLINEDAGPQSLPNWATGITVGPANEIGQTLMFVLSNDNSTLFSVQPSLNAAGDLSYTPALNAFGNATVTVVLSDSAGGTALSQTFTINVTPVNDLPTISDIVNQSILPDTSTAALPFTIGDIETPAGTLGITVASSNLTLVPLTGITIAGSGASRTITVTPTLGQTGNTTITLTVDDGTGGLVTDSFVLTVSNLLGTLTAQLVGGNLTIEDLAGRNNEFEIHVSGGNLVVTDAAEMFDASAAVATGGSLSNGNRTLSVPLASITGTASVLGRDGEDSYVLGDLAGLIRLALLGGNDNDLFGTTAQKISPAPSTTIIISGEEDPAFGAPVTRNTFGATGDVLNLDISPYSTGIEIVDTTSGLALSASTTLVAHQPLYFNNVEDINLCDNAQATNTIIGDLYVRTTAGNESLVFYRGYSSVTDVLTKINGRLISSTPFRPTGTILFFGRGGNDTAELNFTLGTQVRAEFHGEGGNDTFWGGALNDLLVGGNGSDKLISSDGNDTLWGDNIPTTWAERQTGNATGVGPHNDSLYGGNGADFLYGQSGNDAIYGEGGDDYSHGGDGNDTLADTLGVNILRGEAGADSISGSDGSDLILGGADNDVITGFGGRDIMIGGTGLDNVQDTNDAADDVLIGDSSPLESDDNGTNFAGLSNHDVTLNSVFTSWRTAASFAAGVTMIQSSGLKATAPDGARDVLRGNQLNNNYYQNLGQAELVRTTGAGDVVDVL